MVVVVVDADYNEEICDKDGGIHNLNLCTQKEYERELGVLLNKRTMMYVKERAKVF